LVDEFLDTVGLRERLFLRVDKFATDDTHRLFVFLYEPIHPTHCLRDVMQEPRLIRQLLVDHDLQLTQSCLHNIVKLRVLCRDQLVTKLPIRRQMVHHLMQHLLIGLAVNISIDKINILSTPTALASYR
jgi:hypothetical protein